MKANELMLGDWVECSNAHVRVEGLASSTIQVKKERFMYAATEGQINPIPLTKEILERNGLDLQFGPTWFPEDENGELEITWFETYKIARWTINGNEYWIKNLRYVHELQHAIKLCGFEKDIIL